MPPGRSDAVMRRSSGLPTSASGSASDEPTMARMSSSEESEMDDGPASQPETRGFVSASPLGGRARSRAGSAGEILSFIGRPSYQPRHLGLRTPDGKTQESGQLGADPLENNVEVTSMTQCASRPRKPRPSQPSDGSHVDVGPGGRPDQGDIQPNRVRAPPKPARDPRLRQPVPS